MSVGHTHEDVDQFFQKFSHIYQKLGQKHYQVVIHTCMLYVSILTITIEYLTHLYVQLLAALRKLSTNVGHVNYAYVHVCCNVA